MFLEEEESKNKSNLKFSKFKMCEINMRSIITLSSGS